MYCKKIFVVHFSNLNFFEIHLSFDDRCAEYSAWEQHFAAHPFSKVLQKVIDYFTDILWLKLNSIGKLNLICLCKYKKKWS